MKLKKLTLKNIRSFKKQEVIFPEGSTILSGDIGSGKTSILLAIEFALFGLQPGQRGSSLLAKDEEAGFVSLEFEINGDHIKVERSLRRGSKSINQEGTAITINDRKTELSITEVKTKILELLSYPNEFIKKNNILYRFTVYTPQEEMKEIIQEDPETRLNILRHVFGIDKYKRIRENLSVLTSHLREDSRSLQTEIKDLDEGKEKLESSIRFVKILEEKIKSKKMENEKLLLRREEIEKSIQEVELKIKEKENFQKEVEKTEIMILNKEEQLSHDQSSIEELEDMLSKEKDYFEEEELEKVSAEIKKSKERIENFNKDLILTSSKIQSLEIKKQEDLEKKNRIFKIDICPTCLQDVSENHKHNILNETESQIKKAESEESGLKGRLEKIAEELAKYKQDLSALEERKSGLELSRVKTQEIKFAKERISILLRSREAIKKDLEFLRKHIQDLKTSSLEFTKYDNILKIKKEELNRAFQIEKQSEVELAEFRKEKELTEKEISDLQKKIEKTERTRAELIETIELESWLSTQFSELVSFTEKNIMVTLREEFSKLFNKWFSILTTDNFYVHLDENFTPVIIQNDYELDYNFLSGGERTAVALAYRLALNQTINSIMSKIKTQGLIILDEPTDGFSENQLDKMRDILHELNAKQLILVSHEQKLESFVENIIRLKKQSGISKIGE